MTQMPELVAAMHSLVGLAAVLIAIAEVNNPTAFGLRDPIPMGNRLELFIGTFIGAITFSGSVIAFGKLAGKLQQRAGRASRVSTCSTWRSAVAMHRLRRVVLRRGPDDGALAAVRPA